MRVQLFREFAKAVLLGDMRNKIDTTSLTAAEIARRWGYRSSSSVLRTMKRFGISGTKFGAARQAARRFTEENVRLVERLAGGGLEKQVPHAPLQNGQPPRPVNPSKHTSKSACPH